MSEKKPFSGRIEPTVATRFAAAVRGVRLALGPEITQGQCLEAALVDWCERMEAAHNRGQQWALPSARPVTFTPSTPVEPDRP